MTSLADYGSLFRAAYAALHGGEPDEGAADSGRRPDESLEEFLARSRSEALERLRGHLEAAEPPPALSTAHQALIQLLASALEADAALAAQVAAYRCGNFQGSIAHSDRVHTLIVESTRLDRDLILALRKAEEAAPGTLADLGIGEIASPP